MKKFSPEEKYQIVQEGRQSRKGVKSVCKKYGLSRETFYQWEARIKEGALSALEDKPPGPKPPEREEQPNEEKQELEKLQIDYEVLRLKHEWMQFQVSLHGNQEQKETIKQSHLKKNSFPRKRNGGS